MSVPKSIAVFWDYENQAKPKTKSFLSTWNTIRSRLLEQFDRIDYCWVFMNTATSQVNEKLRIEICNSGCNIVDCAASSAQKSAQIDQRIIVSLLNSAFVDKDRAVCLVSADGDYCHVLNLLRNNRVFTVLMYNTHGAALNPMCMESVDICSGINFIGNCADEQELVAPEQDAAVADPKSLFLRSVEECPGVDPNGAGEKTWKLSSTVGQIFRDKIGVMDGITSNERKRLFGSTRLALAEDGKIEVQVFKSVNYIKKIV